jgi:hypothetical protein
MRVKGACFFNFVRRTFIVPKFGEVGGLIIGWVWSLFGA